LLEKLGTSPMITALQMALPVIFESHISSRLDKSDPSQLGDALYYSVRNSLSDETVQKIIDDLIPLMNDLSPRQTVSIVWSMADSKRKLLRQDAILVPALKSLANTFDQLSFDEITTTMSKLSRKYSRATSYFYNEDLVAKFCQFLTESEVTKNSERLLYPLRSITHLVFKIRNLSFLDTEIFIFCRDTSTSPTWTESPKSFCPIRLLC
jgi:hypothetical protein